LKHFKNELLFRLKDYVGAQVFLFNTFLAWKSIWNQNHTFTYYWLY